MEVEKAAAAPGSETAPEQLQEAGSGQCSAVLCLLRDASQHAQRLRAEILALKVAKVG